MSQNFAEPPVVKKRDLSVTLIVIGLLLLLGIFGWVFLLPVLTHQIKGKAARLKTLAVMKDLEVATGHYRVEYDRFPVAPPDTEIRSTGDFIRALLGDNPRNIKFVELPVAKDGKFGLLESSLVETLVDPWGEPYYLILDTNEDGKLRNPEGGAEIQKPMIIYSAGPDRDPKTWADNITNWR